MQRFIDAFETLLMNRLVGITCVAVAMALTYVFHSGLACYALSEAVGNLLGLPHDQGVRLLVGLLSFGAGFVFMGAVILGMVFRYRIAFFLSSFVFLAAVPVAIYYQLVAVDYTRWSSVRDAGIAMLSVGCAAYCWRLSVRHSAPWMNRRR